MRKIAGAAALALMFCSFALCQLQIQVLVDSRMAGTWKLASERVLAGPSIAPSLALGTIMTIRKDADGRTWIRDGAKSPVFGRVVLSPDGNTMTGTLESPERQYYRVVRVWKRQ